MIAKEMFYQLQMFLKGKISHFVTQTLSPKLGIKVTLRLIHFL
jgi:hypothetical protein